MKAMNEMSLSFLSVSANESFARAAVSAFASQLDPTIDQLADLKTAVSEAVTNCIVHAYEHGEGKIFLDISHKDQCMTITVEDFGIGISDVEKAMEPMYTTKAEEERTGMGFSFMEAFMDKVEVISETGRGTKVIMSRTIGGKEALYG